LVRGILDKQQQKALLEVWKMQRRNLKRNLRTKQRILGMIEKTLSLPQGNIQ